MESCAFTGGRFVATATGVEARYFVTDHLGSVRAVVSLRQSLGRRLAVGQPLPLQRQGGSGFSEQSLPGLRSPAVRFGRCRMAG